MRAITLYINDHGEVTKLVEAPTFTQQSDAVRMEAFSQSIRLLNTRLEQAIQQWVTAHEARRLRPAPEGTNLRPSEDIQQRPERQKDT